MNERTLAILDAAQTVFARYGVAKTTMGDIAEAAGVARQTVYNAFATKNDVLRAAVRIEVDRCIAEVTEAWKTATSLDERIEQFHRLGPIKWYEVVEASPDLADLLEGMHHIAKAELAQAEESWEELFVKMFEAEGITCKDPNVGLKELADYIYSTAKNAKFGAKSKDELKYRLHVLRLSIGHMVES